MTTDMDPTLALCCELIRRESVTPEDAGCQALMMERLSAIGFECTELNFGAVRNFWAERGCEGPSWCLRGIRTWYPPDLKPSGVRHRSSR